ncbi:MAG: Mov34/MPN/PAD-1 family protein [Myxococcales bacterium]|nr:Mov34/MPN/PAD-1 family protein [Myxococcales bacterium]
MSDQDSPPIVEIPEAALRDIFEHARAEFPNECCGYLIGSGSDLEVRRCKNRQDQLHALDPEAHPRTAANAYNIGGRELLDLVRSFEGERPATVIYHSHPRVGAYFSAEDERAALAAGYPVAYLVIDAQEGEIREALLFRRGADGGEAAYGVVARFPGAAI